MNSPEDAIRRAAKLDQFQKDETIDGILKGLAVRYYDEFRAADSSEKRIQAWAKTNVLQDFLSEMRVVIDNGENAVLTAARAAAKQRKELD